jgi:glutamate/tyrosine decarboxylase-like PLP-dependent enzyme
VEGVARADSWATDAHKWLNVPQDSGIAIVRDAEALGRSMSIAAAYYPPDADGKRQPMQLGPESSRRARAVEIWAALRSLGKQGVADLIDRCCQHAATFADALRAGGFEVLNDVVLNQVLVWIILLLAYRWMCGYDVLGSVLAGAAVTLRNVAVELFLGVQWGEYGR